MASAGLKRPSDYDLEYPSQINPSGSIVDPCQWSANKRRCTAYANQSMMASPMHMANANPNHSPNIHNNLQQTQNHNQQNNFLTHHQSATTSAAQSPVAPSPSSSSSHFKDPTLILGSLCDDVTSIIKNEVHRAQHQQQPNHQQQTQHHQNQPQNSHPSLPINYDEPTLSVRQTQAICEKIIREREQRLREEYDKILVSKLAEQYDTFVKYTHDHIEKHYGEASSHQSSYLS